MAALERIRFSPWLIVLLAASFALGESAGLLTGLVCVFLHELGHAACAAVCGCVVEQIEIAPFGGVERVLGLERMTAGKSLLIALAGPAVNVLLFAVCGCGAYLLPHWTPIWARGMSANLALFLFNLLPAYPMDGGRALCACLQNRTGYVRAQRITAGLGTALGIVMMLLGIVSIRFAGKLNLTLLICGGYLYRTALRARRETPYSYLQMLLGREKELRRKRILPVRTIAVRCGTPDAEIVGSLRPGMLHRIVYLDEEMCVCQEKWENELR